MCGQESSIRVYALDPRVRLKGERHMKMWISGTPAELNKKYYWVTAGEDNGMSLVTHFNFHVYPDSMRIMYYDATEDHEITLKEWEARKE